MSDQPMTVEAHWIISGLFAIGLLAVSGYGIGALWRFTRFNSERIARRTAWLVTAAWVGLVANQVHALFVDPMLAQRSDIWQNGLRIAGLLLMIVETGILALLIAQFRRGALTQLIDLLRDVPRLRQEAGLDELTGLFNRRVLTMVEGRMNWPYWASLMVDVDDFKRYNDCHGHLAGDGVLASVGDCIRSSVRSSDLAFRYGGEEFLILCPLSSPEEAIIVAERLGYNLRLIGAPVSVSIGVAAGSRERTLRQSIAQADEAVYRAKAKGKAQVVVWNSSQSESFPN